jgi:GTP cyclohydrolase I
MGKQIHVGYVSSGKVIGLSKLARIAKMFAQRLQVQERLTVQIAVAIMDNVKAQGVAVIIEAGHLCMGMRGVEKCGSSTVTECFLGSMKMERDRREDFFRLLGVGKK